jgi:hypothetical protein
MAPCDPKPALGFYGRPRSGVLPPDLPGDESDGGCGYGHACYAFARLVSSPPVGQHLLAKNKNIS